MPKNLTTGEAIANPPEDIEEMTPEEYAPYSNPDTWGICFWATESPLYEVLTAMGGWADKWTPQSAKDFVVCLSKSHPRCPPNFGGEVSDQINWDEVAAEFNSVTGG